MDFEFETNYLGHIEGIPLLDPSIPDEIDSTFWQELNIGVFDVETTGLNYENPGEFRITQFAGAIYTKKDYKEANKLDEINVRINPEIKTPNDVIEATGIYNSNLDDPATIEKHGKYDTADCPTWEEVDKKIARFMYRKADCWCAYNHVFDVNAYASETFRKQRKQQGEPRYSFRMLPTIDPLMFQRYRKGDLKGNSLWGLARDFGVASTGSIIGGEQDIHEAQTDVRLLNPVLWEMSFRMPMTINNLIHIQSKLLKEQEEEIRLED